LFASVPAAAQEPRAYLLYQIANPSEFPTSGPTSIKWPPKVERDIRAIDRSVNRSMRQRNDPPGEDNWRADVPAGDCEDFALTKRRRLIAMGYPPRALRIMIVSRFKPKDHVVLRVSTTKRVYVLDMDRKGK